MRRDSPAAEILVGESAAEFSPMLSTDSVTVAGEISISLDEADIAVLETVHSYRACTWLSNYLGHNAELARSSHPPQSYWHLSGGPLWARIRRKAAYISPGANRSA